MLQKLQPYNKLIVALLGAVVTVVVQFYADNSAVQVVVAVLTALGVYQVPNRIEE
jgi:FtsH-binding integral membrane protein